MEIRKLQKTGGSSLSLILPKKWIDELGLKDKDTVKIAFQKSGILTVNPIQAKQQPLKSTLIIDNLTDSMLTRELIAYYISGVDEITIMSKQIAPDQRNKIRKLFQLLIGFEIIDESATKILVKNIFDAKKFPIPQSIEKMFHITQSMVKDACEALFTHNIPLAHDVINRDFEVDKLYLAITRQLHVLMRNNISEEEIGLNEGNLYYFEDIAVQIERIADHGVKVGTIVALDKTVEKPTYSPSSQNLVQEIMSLMEQAEQMVKNQDNTLAHNILDVSEKMGKITSPYAKLGQDITVIQLMLENSLDRIRGYIMNMAEMTIDQHASQEIS